MRNGAARSSATGTTAGQRRNAHAPAAAATAPSDERGCSLRGHEPFEVVARKERHDQHRLRGGEQDEPADQLGTPRPAEDDQRRACGSGQRGDFGERLVRHRGCEA